MLHTEHLTRTDEYSITDDEGRKIYFTIENKSLITLQRGSKGDYKFMFVNSKSETIKAIAEMFLEAVKVFEKEGSP